MADTLTTLPDHAVNEQVRQDRLAWGWYALGAAASTALIIGIPAGGLTTAIDALKTNKSQTVQTDTNNPLPVDGKTCLSDSGNSGKLTVYSGAELRTGNRETDTTLANRLGRTSLESLYVWDFCYEKHGDVAWYGLDAEVFGAQVDMDISHDRDGIVWVREAETQLTQLDSKHS